MSGQRIVTRLKEIDVFESTIKRLFVGDTTLTNDDKTFLLSSALVLLRKYEKDNSYKTYLEFGYYIILKYSILFNDFKPLYDFSINFGFYPITNAISQNIENFSTNIHNEILEYATEKSFRHDNIIETLEQHKAREAILNSDFMEISYVAPTSFGKSSIIVEHIKEHQNTHNKIAIIVPSKSLLMQTYRMIRNAKLGYRILVHDEMFIRDERFIAVFTQERALRLTSKYSTFFDILYIDEAHKMFDRDARSILLSRLIKQNNFKNPDNKILYLSPMIDKSDNLKLLENQDISQHKIIFNMKEPEVFEYKLSGQVLQYNKFLDEFYEIRSIENKFSYITNNATFKNFLYLYSPRKIELFAKKLYDFLPELDDEISREMKELVNNLCSYVHEDFYVVDYLKKGIIYIHGKMPDNIKDYLEYKFSSIPKIKYIIANKVILEGMNLPVDSLFIIQPHAMTQKDLINLIGRVNRLNMIFSSDSTDLSKLLPKVHFVNNEDFYRNNSNMSSKVKFLRKIDYRDDVENPLLSSFNMEKFSNTNLDDILEKQKCETIIANEDIVFSEPDTPVANLKKKMLELGLDAIYKISDGLCETIQSSITESLNTAAEGDHIIDLISLIFIKNVISHIHDDEFRRLNNPAAINYYKMFIDSYRQKPLKERISLEVSHLIKKSNTDDDFLLYMGKSYGERPYDLQNYTGQNVYINLKEKTKQDIVNISIVKLKIEEDFISFKINKFLQLMLDYNLITDSQYNLVVYGTDDEDKLFLVKMGLTLNIVNKLIEDKQLSNIFRDSHKNLAYNSDFEAYKESVDDFFRFELERFL